MAWVWQHKDWANFEYDSSKLYQYESDFLLNAGKILGLIQVVELIRQALFCLMPQKHH